MFIPNFRKKNFVQEAVPIRSLLSLLTLSDDHNVQRVVLSLYNALFNVAGRDKKVSMRRTMEELNIRNVILTKILIKEPSEEMKRQLFVTQINLFDEAANQMRIPVEAQDQVPPPPPAPPPLPVKIVHQLRANHHQTRGLCTN